MADEKNAIEDKGRRKAIKKIAVGVGALASINALPAQWIRPIVDQIAMPAHAATSGTAIHDPCSITLVSGDQSTASVSIRIDGYVTPPTANLPTAIVGTSSQGASATVNTSTAADGTFQGTLTLNDGPGITSISVVTTVTGADGSAGCSINIPAAAETTTLAPTTTPTPTTSSVEG